MVVLLTVPSTRTDSPVVMALADVELVPFRYVVVDASLTVTFWPADVVRLKPDEVTLVTVPEDPPVAGPDRALDPPPPDSGPPAALPPGAPVPADTEGDVAVVDEGVVEDDAAAQLETPITAAITGAATSNTRFLFDSNRRSPVGGAGGGAAGGGGGA
jgi:hypothetical protein